MRSLRRRNPAKPNYNVDEILKLCKLTTLTFPEIAILLDIPKSVVVRVCAKKTKRASGRPMRLSEFDIKNKLSQVTNFYKKNKQYLAGKSNIQRLQSHLMERLAKESRLLPKLPEKTIDKKPASKKKKVLKRKSTLTERTAEPVTEKTFRLTQEQALVIDFLIEKHRQAQNGTPLKMAVFAKHKGVNPQNFARIVKKHLPNVLHIANEMILRGEQAEIEEKYRYYVIDYLARQELLSEDDKTLTKLEYVEQNQLDHSIFMKYFRQFRHLVKDEVLMRYRELEEERLQKLRGPSISVYVPEEEKKPILQLLEKAARKKLPVRRGHVVFSPDRDENKRLEEAWLHIAEDVSRIGLKDVVADKWAHEMGLPVTLTKEERNYLILLRIETVLTQLELFQPPRTVAFETYLGWIEEQKREKSEETAKEPEPEPQPLISAPSSPAQSQSEFDEKWLEEEIAREEAAARRFLDTPEERLRRRREGSIISAQQAEALSRSQLEELKLSGALYDKGDWLLPDPSELVNYRPVPVSSKKQLAGWRHTRKPKLLIAIGETDYTKDWMRKIFDVELARDASSFRSKYYSFLPDAIMIYKSSAGKKLYDEVTAVANEVSAPLLIFDKGFADLLLSAQKQHLQWFVDAYEKRRSWERRLNPINWAKLFRSRRY